MCGRLCVERRMVADVPVGIVLSGGLDSSLIVDSLGDAIAAMSEPMVSHDAVAFSLLSEEVSRSRKVVPSGQGADEVFGGYWWHPPMAGADGLGTDEYARVFFDRGHEDLGEFLADEHVVGKDTLQEQGS